MQKQKENSHEGITWSEMGKQNVQAKKVYCSVLRQQCRMLPIGDNRRIVTIELFPGVLGTREQKHLF